ncbi:hypothetical protein DSL72_007344 [Monilinia vaccinii-corymbosi]|uniref:C3H1-type domain-containing protein n=1 Tax=Monilinia vaccinii-corymbosi TaxID=61207 RepID=A0A8A3PLK9_9HELO|nr:hypothetical protein DSL72_007344 [Monilinia vaccinii-corymbosi]
MRGVQVCHFWREGRCTRGVDCKFSHSDESNDGSSASSELTYLTQRTRSLNSTPARLTRNTGSIITTIKRVSLDNLPLRADAPITITGFQFAASYNLVWTKSLSIMVPGCPPIWSPPPMPIKLKADNHKTLIGRAQYQTQVSMAPVLAALSVSITDTSTLPSIDLITDRNSLRKLLDFVNGKVGQTWKIDVELVRNTMIFAKNAEGISRHKSDGYGFPFEAAFLKYPEELKGTSEHHRIATYDIGGMKWMVRFEADGCYDAQSTEGLSQSPGTPGTLRSSSEIEEATYKNIKIHKTATAISTLPILEVKTAKLNRSPKRSQWMPQLYFSQTNHLIIANHDDGIFDHANIKESDQTENMRQWEQENQGMLQKLLHLIDEKMITQLWGSPAMPMP